MLCCGLAVSITLVATGTPAAARSLITVVTIAVRSDTDVHVCADMGSGLYAASKAIAVSDLIATVTPERRGEDRTMEYGKKPSIRGSVDLMSKNHITSPLYVVSSSPVSFFIVLSPPLLSYPCLPASCLQWRRC